MNAKALEFIAQCSPNRSTRDAYKAALKRLAAVAGGEEVDSRNLARVLKALSSRCKPATVAQSLVVLRQLHRFLGLPDPVEGSGYKAKPYDNVPADNVLREGDLGELLGKVEDPRDRAIITTLALQGWRVSTLCNMTWGNLRQGSTPGTMVAEFKAKRNKLQIQGVQTAVLEAVRALGGKVSSSSPFLPAEDGRAYTRFQVYGIITRLSKAFGRPITPHGLRATYVSSVIARKGIEAARQLAGHANISTTQRYSRWKIESDDPLTVEDL